MILGNVRAGYRMNVSKELVIMEEDKPTSQRTNYVGYMMVDGAPITSKAFAYLKKSA